MEQIDFASTTTHYFVFVCGLSLSAFVLGLVNMVRIKKIRKAQKKKQAD